MSVLKRASTSRSAIVPCRTTTAAAAASAAAPPSAAAVGADAGGGGEAVASSVEGAMLSAAFLQAPVAAKQVRDGNE